ncbi:MAG: PhzF family phenazine biosynthesis protein [Ignavibacteriales bacterium]|nr:MAG: PhzF family phenazine biosynthesis protein [Ignavibacteriales bacterium]
MKRKSVIFQIDAFTEIPFKGNPAGVTFASNLTDEEMQLIAREMNLSETAFIGTSENADYKLRWFTPTHEVPLCGHATIASLHFLNELDKIQKRNKITFETLSGVLNCPVTSDEYSMQIPILSMEEFDGCNEEIIESLGLERTAVDDKIPFILLENDYLYIYADSLKALKETAPNFSLVKILGEKYGFKAICLFTLETFDTENFAHSRFFTPYYGIDEDPVTGSANGPLMLVLEKLNFIKEPHKTVTKIFEQGDIINRRGRVKVTHYPETNELYIGGKAVTIIKGELFL